MGNEEVNNKIQILKILNTVVEKISEAIVIFIFLPKNYNIMYLL